MIQNWTNIDLKCYKMGPGAPFGTKGSQKRHGLVPKWCPFGLENDPKMVKNGTRNGKEKQGRKTKP